jgi:hypothetical protein
MRFKGCLNGEKKKMTEIGLLLKDGCFIIVNVKPDKIYGKYTGSYLIKKFEELMSSSI